MSLADIYILLSRQPNEETLRRVATMFDEYDQPEHRGELVAEARRIRQELGSPDGNDLELAVSVREHLSNRHLTNEDKDKIRAQGVEVPARNMWQAG